MLNLRRLPTVKLQEESVGCGCDLASIELICACLHLWLLCVSHLRKINYTHA